MKHRKRLNVAIMVLSKPENQNVLKAFELTGKVATVTGKGMTALPMIAEVRLIYKI